jgi:hypothetical protein
VSRTQARRVCGAVWKMKDIEVGFREQASNHPKRHRSKAIVVSVGGKGRRYRSGVDHGDERERTPDDVSKGSLATSKPGALLGQGWEVPDDTGVRHGGGVILASIRNVRTCRSDVTGAGQAGGPRKSTKAEHRGGAARSREEGSVMELERRVVRWDGDGQPDTGKERIAAKCCESSVEERGAGHRRCSEAKTARHVLWEPGVGNYPR